jgi:protein-S-isoprenylcysteine O-methyltransferase Ste14
MPAQKKLSAAPVSRPRPSVSLDGAPVSLAGASANSARTRGTSEFARQAFRRLRDLIVRRRIFISFLLFASLTIAAVVNKVPPRDLANAGDPLMLAGLLGVVGGLALRSWAAGFLVKNDRLTTDGPYALVRNPLYLGSFLMILGFCVLVNVLANVWVVLVVIPCIYVPKVLSEERLLLRLYPSEWPIYSARTPRFCPRRLVWPTLSGWRGSQWMMSREYNAVAAVAVGLVLLKVLHDYYLAA